MELGPMLIGTSIQNPHASAPLIYGLDVACNTDDETLRANVLTNAKRIKRWAKTVPAHGRRLVICGSGPSIAEHMQEIRQAWIDGAEVWALNNAANYLASRGAPVDVQVIMDAQAATKAAICHKAREHYFASQVDPILFETVPNALLWHATLGNELPDEQEGFPLHDDEYCLVGSSISIGNTALKLAYALGFRTIDLYGYDASAKGTTTHAMHQPWNDGEPTTIVEVGAYRYVASLTMALQAQYFPEIARALEAEGCTIRVHGYGLLPDLWNKPVTAETEAEKYQRIWARPEYRFFSPAVAAIDEIKDALSDVPAGAHVLDFGCGAAIAAGLLSETYRVTGIDHVDVRERDVPFVKACLWELPEGLSGDAGVCCDVMEHIPTDKVDAVLAGIARCVPRCFFTISFEPDAMGALIGETLHLTVRPAEWWADKLGKHFDIVVSLDNGRFLALKGD